MTLTDLGWEWFDSGEPVAGETSGQDAHQASVTLAFTRCFNSSDGERVLGYLRSLTLERAVGPNASDALLRQLEGQRRLVIHIANLADRGRGHARRAS